MDESGLRSVWEASMGQKLEALPFAPGATVKPPVAEGGGTLSGGATLGPGTVSGGATLGPGTVSGGATLGPGTLSGGATLGPGGAAGPTSGPPGFEIVSELGRGGMGVVFRARQASLGREVALKQALGVAQAKALQARFVSEALVTGGLDHPNIVPVHELARTADGELFMAMKLVGGTSWKDLLHPGGAPRRDGVPAAELDKHLNILLAVGNAVAFAHSKHVLHRDLKPENVMVGDFGEVLVMDWGIAVDFAAVERPGAAAPHKSTIRGPSGTPSYMAPELAEGRGADLGPWTDVYLLGAILHEVLTGRPPHQGQSLMQVLLAASHSAPPRFPASAPAALQAICARSLARAPRDRHASVAELQEDVRRYLKHRESLALSERADRELAELSAVEAVPARDRDQHYARYAKTVARYEQALELWPGNTAADDGVRRARRRFARVALDAGDLGLAAAHVSPLPATDVEGVALRREIDAAHAARTRAARAGKALRVVAALTTLAALGFLGAGYVLVNRERLLVSEQRDKAQAAEREEARQRGLAETQRGLAETQRGLAESREQEARAAKDEAQRRLAATYLRDGLAATDPAVSLLHFVQAARLETDPARLDVARVRLRAYLSSLPLMAGSFDARTAAFDARGSLWVLTNDARLHEVALETLADVAIETGVEPAAVSDPRSGPDTQVLAAGGTIVVNISQHWSWGRRLRTDGGVFAWDAATHRPLWGPRFAGQTTKITTGDRVVAIQVADAVHVVDAATGIDRFVLPEDETWGNSLPAPLLGDTRFAHCRWNKPKKGRESECRLLDQDGRVLLKFGLEDPTGVQRTADGRFFSMNASGGRPHFFDAATGAQLGQPLPTSSDAAWFANTRRVLVSEAKQPDRLASLDGTSRTLPGAPRSVGRVSPDGALFEAFTDELERYLVDSATGLAVTRPFPTVTGLTFSPDSRWMLGETERGLLLIPVVPHGRPERRPVVEVANDGNRRPLSSTEGDTPDQLLLDVDDEGRATVHDGATYERIEGLTVDLAALPPPDAEKDPNADSPVIRIPEPELRFITDATRKRAIVVRLVVTVETFGADRHHVSRVGVFDLTTGKLLGPPVVPTGALRDAELIDDGSRLVLGTSSGLEVVDVATGKATLSEMDNAVWDVIPCAGGVIIDRREYSEGAHELGVASLSTDVVVAPLCTLEHTSGSRRGASADGRTVWAVAGKEVLLLDVAGLRATGTLRFDAEVTSVVGSPDGRWLAVHVGDAVRVFSVADAAPMTKALPVPVTPAPDRTRVGMAFSRDGRLFAIAAGPVQVFDVETGFPVTPPLTSKTSAYLVRFGDDGRTVRGGDGREWLTWSLAPETLSLDEVEAEAEWFLGRRLDTSGTAVSLSPEERAARMATNAASRAARAASLVPPRRAVTPPPRLVVLSPRAGEAVNASALRVRARAETASKAVQVAGAFLTVGDHVLVGEGVVDEDGTFDVSIPLPLPHTATAASLEVYVVDAEGREVRETIPLTFD